MWKTTVSYEIQNCTDSTVGLRNVLSDIHLIIIVGPTLTRCRLIKIVRFEEWNLPAAAVAILYINCLRDIASSTPICTIILNLSNRTQPIRMR